MSYNSPTSEDRANGKRWGHGTCWSEEEIQFVRDHMDLSATEISKTIGRSRSSVYHVMQRIKSEVPEESYAVKEPGQYVELLHSFVAEDFELCEIWGRWNGYSTVDVISRDRHMMCTVLCTAK